MEPIILAAGTALVGAIATDAWEQIRDAVTGLWRRIRPQHADSIETELEDLREQVLAARSSGDANTVKALEGAWQVKLQQLLRADPSLAVELQRLLDHLLIPALSPPEQVRIGSLIMSGSSHDSSTFTQIGSQINFNRP